MILGTIGVICFALGMCMCLLPEWGMANEGTVTGAIGVVVLLITAGIWRKMEGLAPIRVTLKNVVIVFVGLLGALLFGVGMCLTMLFGKMVLGVVVGVIGIVVLLMLIPMVKGIR